MIIEHKIIISKKLKLLIKSIQKLTRFSKKTLTSISINRKQVFVLPKKIENTKLTTINGINIVEFIENEGSSNNHIIYLPGGAFRIKGNQGHYGFIDELRNLADISVSYIDYPLTPKFKAREIILMTKEIVKKVIRERPNKFFSIIGDNAGGNLALTIVKQLQEENFDVPVKLFLLSPWVDLSMNNKILKKLTHKEFMFTREELLSLAKLYADDLNLNDKRISPIYDNFNDLNIIIYAGDADILYPDIEAFAIKNQSVILNKYYNLPHGFPMLGKTHERQIVIEDIKNNLIE